MYSKYVIVVLVATFAAFASGQSYEDKRCKCVCPSPAAVFNKTVADKTADHRRHYIANVPPNKCNCAGVIIPRDGPEILGREQEFCPRCECKYENRNTTIIKVVVIIVIWVIMLLVVYMGFLICLDPLINKRAKASYQEHTNEDDESTLGGPSTQMGARGNVLNRVTHQQDKWKRQVREQRRNIYDRHTMLN
ncbi:hypothetical protein ABMA27_000075 [Loxostege sticticalis]|uniref:TMEM9 family protein n=1 Tax=Loxostege sticticalis TaxID=481309 RepID=A0ABR3IM29_LOXSC